jgi:hypothetical protein
MFAVGWGTVVVVQGNIFAYLYANLLVVCCVRNFIYRVDDGAKWRSKASGSVGGLCQEAS